jgi:hypothetical protein
MPCTALAASTNDAKGAIITDRECSLTVSYRCNGNAADSQTVKLYMIAEVSADAHYTLVPSFAASGLILNGVQTTGEWNVIRSTLEVQILANKIIPIKTSVTDEKGQAHFSQLTPGLYFASAVTVVQGESTCRFESALVALPGFDTEDLWQYQVAVAAKPQTLPPVQPDEEIQFKVIKLWKGEEDRDERPQSVEVELFCNGISYKTVVLSNESNWSYSWSAKKDGATWKVLERNIPEGYIMTVEERGTSFIVTNTKASDTPIDPPPTGDTSNIFLYILLMTISGSALVIIGATGKRNRL